MRGPAGMGDPESAAYLRLIHHLGERGHTTDAAQAAQTAIDYREARRVVTAIFQFAQAFQQDGNNVMTGDRAYNSTHGINDW